MKREFFQASKYSLMVGVMTTIEVSASDGVGSNSCASSSRLFAWRGEFVERRLVDVGVGQALAELDLAVAVDVGLDALRLQVGVGPVERGLGQEEEVARLFQLLAVGVVRLKETASSGVEASEPASMSTSYWASRGTPATIPSICS